MRRVLQNMVFSSLSLLLITSVSAGSVQAKKLSVYERQVKLTKEVEKAQSNKELTLKEADHLRERLTNLNERKEKMMSKNAGKLSYKDEEKLEKTLNSISVDIQKKRLDKRVQ